MALLLVWTNNQSRSKYWSMLNKKTCLIVFLQGIFDAPIYMPDTILRCKIRNFKKYIFTLFWTQLNELFWQKICERHWLYKKRLSIKPTKNLWAYIISDEPIESKTNWYTPAQFTLQYNIKVKVKTISLILEVRSKKRLLGKKYNYDNN